MWINRALALTILTAALPGAGGAQAPISAIDWLDRLESRVALQPRAGLLPGEPPVTDSAGVPIIEVRPLDELGDGPVGLLPPAVTGLPVSLWRGSEPARVAGQLADMQAEGMPAIQSVLISLLLTEAAPPAREGDSPDLLLARLDKLAEIGAVEPALGLAQAAGPETHPEIFRRYFDLSLLAGTEAEACARLAGRPDLAPDVAARIYCLARSGDWQAAMLTHTSASALDNLSPVTERLLSLFLAPELIESTPPLPPPSRMTPLLFRLEEAIGQPPATTNLPRAYAFADLRELSGWKAELEAVERLARAGAVSENRLLGTYTSRRPAASGGIWDRVAAIQAFDAAMESGEPEAVADTVTAAWAAMEDARLELPFARLYGARLSHFDLPGRPAQSVAFRVALLSPDYEAAARRMTPGSAEERFLAALARGMPGDAAPYSARSRAVAAGFDTGAEIEQGLARLVEEDRLGEAILRAMALYARAVEGELKDAGRALASFRALGLEETARRAALEMLILDRSA